MKGWLDRRFSEVAKMAVMLPTPEMVEPVIGDTPIVIRQETRKDGVIICDTSCIFYDGEQAYCIIFNAVNDEKLYLIPPKDCPGPGEYQLCPK